MAAPRFRYYVAASLDGFIADAEGELDWLLAFGFEEFQAHYDAFLASVGAVVMGRSTLDWVLEHDDGPWAYTGLPCWVATNRELPMVDGAELRAVSGPVAARVDDIRASAGGRDVWVVGGGDVAGQFLAAGALDELQLTVMPVLLGGGVPVLALGDGHRRLVLERTTPFPSGAIELRYRVAR